MPHPKIRKTRFGVRPMVVSFLNQIRKPFSKKTIIIANHQDHNLFTGRRKISDFRKDAESIEQPLPFQINRPHFSLVAASFHFLKVENLRKP